MKTVKKIINGLEYTAVWKGMAFANETRKKCRIGNTNMVSDYKVAEIVFSEIIISPKVNINDFEDMNTFYEVLDFGGDVLFGTYWNKSKLKLKREVEAERSMWRLIFNGVGSLDYDYVFYEMTPEEIYKANIALDMVIEEMSKAANKK